MMHIQFTPQNRTNVAQYVNQTMGVNLEDIQTNHAGSTSTSWGGLLSNQPNCPRAYWSKYAMSVALPPEIFAGYASNPQVLAINMANTSSHHVNKLANQFGPERLNSKLKKVKEQSAENQKQAHARREE